MTILCRPDPVTGVKIFEKRCGGAAQFEAVSLVTGSTLACRGTPVRAEYFLGGTHGFLSAEAERSRPPWGSATHSVTPGGAENPPAQCKSRSDPMSVRLTTA